MKKAKRNMVYAWALLLLFAAGQYTVFAHTHKASQITTPAKHGVTVLKERCDICDVMHHTHMILTHHVYFAPAVSITYHYQFKQSDVQLIQLVLASGRAPPVA